MKKIKSSLIRIFYISSGFMVLTASCVLPKEDFKLRETAGPATNEVDLNAYDNIWYVAQRENFDEAGDGTKKNPFQTISQAVSKIQLSEPSGKFAVLVTEGIYHETIIMQESVDFYGGYSPDEWQRNIFRYQSVIDGNNEIRLAEFPVLPGAQLKGVPRVPTFWKSGLEGFINLFFSLGRRVPRALPRLETGYYRRLYPNVA